MWIGQCEWILELDHGHHTLIVLELHEPQTQINLCNSVQAGDSPPSPLTDCPVRMPCEDALWHSINCASVLFLACIVLQISLIHDRSVFKTFLSNFITWTCPAILHIFFYLWQTQFLIDYIIEGSIAMWILSGGLLDAVLYVEHASDDIICRKKPGDLLIQGLLAET